MVKRILRLVGAFFGALALIMLVYLGWFASMFGNRIAVDGESLATRFLDDLPQLNVAIEEGATAGSIYFEASNQIAANNGIVCRCPTRSRYANCLARTLWNWTRRPERSFSHGRTASVLTTSGG